MAVDQSQHRLLMRAREIALEVALEAMPGMKATAQERMTDAFLRGDNDQNLAVKAALRALLYYGC